MNFEVAKPKLNINIQNSLRLINLIWAQPPHSLFCLFAVVFPLPPHMWSSEKDDVAARCKDCILSVLLIRNMWLLFQETALSKGQFCNEPCMLLTPSEDEKSCAEPHLCHCWEASCLPNRVAGRGTCPPPSCRIYMVCWRLG